MQGFPEAKADQIYKYLGKKRPRSPKKPRVDVDPIFITIRVYRDVIIEGERKKVCNCRSIVIKLLQGFQDVATVPLAENDITIAVGGRDALVIFDMPIDGSEPAPISPILSFNQKVHLCGFAKIDHYTFFCVPGEVQSVEVDNFSISCGSIPGLSGGAVVCDSTGGVIGYCGGAQTGADNSFFGAYAFPTSFILGLLKLLLAPLLKEHTKIYL